MQCETVKIDTEEELVLLLPGKLAYTCSDPAIFYS